MLNRQLPIDLVIALVACRYSKKAVEGTAMEGRAAGKKLIARGLARKPHRHEQPYPNVGARLNEKGAALANSIECPPPERMARMLTKRQAEELVRVCGADGHCARVHAKTAYALARRELVWVRHWPKKGSPEVAMPLYGSAVRDEARKLQAAPTNTRS